MPAVADATAGVKSPHGDPSADSRAGKNRSSQRQSTITANNSTTSAATGGTQQARTRHPEQRPDWVWLLDPGSGRLLDPATKQPRSFNGFAVIKINKRRQSKPRSISGSQLAAINTVDGVGPWLRSISVGWRSSWQHWTAFRPGLPPPCPEFASLPWRRHWPRHPWPRRPEAGLPSQRAEPPASLTDLPCTICAPPLP